MIVYLLSLSTLTALFLAIIQINGLIEVSLLVLVVRTESPQIESQCLLKLQRHFWKILLIEKFLLAASTSQTIVDFEDINTSVPNRLAGIVLSTCLKCIATSRYR